MFSTTYFKNDREKEWRKEKGKKRMNARSLRKKTAEEMNIRKEEGGLRFEWGVYALSASTAIFRARTYNCITYSVR